MAYNDEQSGWTIDTLKEHLEVLIKLELESRDKALELQALELARRLEVLNHAHERAAADQIKFVNQDVFDQRTNSVDQQIKSIENWRANVAGRTAGFGVLLALGVAVLTTIIVQAFS